MKVMLFIHQFRDPSAGGTEVYCRTLAHELKRQGAEVLVVTVDRTLHRPAYSWSRETVDGLDVRFLATPPAERMGFDTWHDDPMTDRQISGLLESERPGAIHLLHLSGLSAGWLAGVPRPGPFVAMTLADHWLYCARGQLLDSDLNLCDGPEASRCARCLGFTGAAYWRHRYKHRWSSGTARVDNRWVRLESGLKRVDLFISPSEDLAARHVELGLVPAGKSVAARYGFPLPGQSARPAPPGRRRIVFIGSLMYSKGAHILLEAFSRLGAPELSLELYGRWSDYHGRGGYRDDCARFLAGPRVTDCGPVPHEEVPPVLARADLLAVPSIWPENSPLVVQEAFLAGTPVMASRIGGLKELVTDGEDGILVTPGDVGAWARALGEWAAGTPVLGGLGAARGKVRSISDDAAGLLRFYGERSHAA